jgi:hypothetical protein
MGDFTREGGRDPEEIDIDPLVDQEPMLAGKPGFGGPGQELDTTDMGVGELAIVIDLEAEGVLSHRVDNPDLVVIQVIDQEGLIMEGVVRGVGRDLDDITVL